MAAVRLERARHSEGCSCSSGFGGLGARDRALRHATGSCCPSADGRPAGSSCTYAAAAVVAAGWNSSGGDCDGFELSRDDCSDRSSGSADKRSGVDVAAAAARRRLLRRESVAVEMGVSSAGRILAETAAGTPERVAQPRGDVVDGRSSHLVGQKTWE